MSLQDSKHFVDMALLLDPEEVLAAFHQLPDQAPETLKAFVQRHFVATDDLQRWTPPDVTVPGFLARLAPERRSWAEALNGLWATLGRTQRAWPQQRSSALRQRNPTVVPGGPVFSCVFHVDFQCFTWFG